LRYHFQVHFQGEAFLRKSQLCEMGMSWEMAGNGGVHFVSGFISEKKPVGGRGGGFSRRKPALGRARPGDLSRRVEPWRGDFL
jgi:hypothetical protein